MAGILLYLILSFSLIAQEASSHPAVLLPGYSNRLQHAFSANTNPASLAGIQQSMAGFIGERKYMMPELGDYSCALALKTASGNLGIDLNHAGDGQFSQNKVGLAYGRALGKTLDVGIQFSYHSRQVSGYGNDGAVGFVLHTKMKLTSQLTAGLKTVNPAGGKYRKTAGEKLPAIFEMGFGFDASEKCFFGFTIVKVENISPQVNAGISYMPVESISVQAGILSHQPEFWCAAGYVTGKWQVNVISKFHPVLGITPGLMLHYKAVSKK